MKILGLVCCRGGSRGVVGKALREINGKTLVDYAVADAVNLDAFDLILTASDSEEIVDSTGTRIFVLPDYLTQDDSPKWKTFQYILTKLSEEREFGEEEVSILVDLDVGTPLRKPEDIAICILKLIQGNYDVVCTAYEADRNPYFNMVEVTNGKVQVVKQLAEPTTNRQQAPKVYALSPAVYAIKREALFKYDHWSQANLGIHVIPRERAWDIDTELDLKIVKFLMEGKP
jgi:N-acylneuraminate cytidylyltransferase/CMP-N,N'-diacetyllegionaminic acid synthase